MSTNKTNLSTIYHCVINYQGRESTRSAAWTLGETNAAMHRLGFEIHPSTLDDLMGFPPFLNKLYRSVRFSGTRDECLTQRKEIDASLRILSSGHIGKYFHCTT